jgi:hypothetical protein
MKHTIILLLALVILFAAVSGQEKLKEEAPSMAPPKSLDDDMHKWMIGEWTGTTESPMGTSEDWQKCEWGLDKQYVVMHLKSKMTKVNEDNAKKMAQGMNMPEKDFMDMMKNSEYHGMGLFTMDPQTGEYVGYWFDSWRGSYKGRGKLEGKKITMNWEGTMGTSIRTIEMESTDVMVEQFKEKDMMGNDMEGKTTLKRKK